MKKERHRLAIIALCAVLAAISCGEENGAPTGPTVVTSIPAVSGSYSGDVSGWLEGEFIGTYLATVTVTQSGDRVSISGTVEGGVFSFETIAGTVGTDGRFTPEDDELPDTEACGRRSEWEYDAVFRNGTFHMRESWQSTGCGYWRFEATLTRT